jgi:hypothetical protein
MKQTNKKVAQVQAKIMDTLQSGVASPQTDGGIEYSYQSGVLFIRSEWDPNVTDALLQLRLEGKVTVGMCVDGVWDCSKADSGTQERISKVAERIMSIIKRNGVYVRKGYGFCVTQALHKMQGEGLITYKFVKGAYQWRLSQ